MVVYYLKFCLKFIGMKEYLLFFTEYVLILIIILKMVDICFKVFRKLRLDSLFLFMVFSILKLLGEISAEVSNGFLFLYEILKEL